MFEFDWHSDYLCFCVCFLGNKRPQTQQAGICSSADRKGEACGGCCGVRTDLKRCFRWMGFCFSTHGHAPKYSTLWPLLYFHTKVFESIQELLAYCCLLHMFLKNFTWTYWALFIIGCIWTIKTPFICEYYCFQFSLLSKPTGLHNDPLI